MLSKILGPAAKIVSTARGVGGSMRRGGPTRKPHPLTLPIKDSLHLEQSGSILTITAGFQHGVTVRNVWLRADNNSWGPAPLRDEVIIADQAGLSVDDAVDDPATAATTATGSQHFVLDLAAIDLSAFADAKTIALGVKLNVYLEVEGPASAIPKAARKWVDEEDQDTIGDAGSPPDSDPRVRGFTPLGRFVSTSLSQLTPVAMDAKTLTPYVSQKGNIAIMVNTSVRPYMRVHIDSIATHEASRFALEGRIYSRHTTIANAKLVLTGRVTRTTLSTPVDLIFDAEATAKRFGLRKHHYATEFPLDEFLTAAAEDDAFDAWIEADVVGTEGTHRARVGKNRFLVRRKAQPGTAASEDRAVSVVPYFTMKVKNLSFQVEYSDRQALDLIEEAIAHPARARRSARAHIGARRAARSGIAARPIWLIGEMPFKAQDTGLSFFKYVVDNHPEIDARYVLRADSPEKINLTGYEDRAVDYRSVEHVRLALAAERIIGSHHSNYIYPTMRTDFMKACTALEVFLQHGVMGMKWMPPTYGKSAPSFSTDLFITSSEREKSMIVEDFGYSPAEVVVTGLSRFDALFEDDVELRDRQILILPTWRDWLGSDDAFRESRFFHEWYSFLNSRGFARLCEKYELDVIFGLHPNMRQHIDMFADTPVRTFVQGEVNVQTLIKQSGVMITDYSSAGLDFSFLHKPLIYFQFDRERFFRGTRSHFDLENELPGPVHFSSASVLNTLENCFSRPQDQVNESYTEFWDRADRLYPFRDRNNRERIFRAIESAARHRSLGDIAHSESAQAVTKRLRKSRYYFPAMQRMFAAAKRLPIDENLIVFESGIGKQYSDSPRAIYEELVRRGDTRTKVWVYNRKPPTADPNTIVVKRLSPQYFWHLGRAKYWVNNQNFPHYVTRRPSGVYVQTWHGTPLKKMQHDLERIEGRAEGYLERVTQAGQQWTHLVSPSPYATSAFATAFRHRAEVLEVGYPRNDVLLQSSLEPERIRRGLDLPEGKKVLLYAPTFRDDQNVSGNRFRFTLPFDLERFAENLGDDYVLLLRMHVVVANRLQIPEHLENVVRDMSSHDDINELYLISDALITDYSSVFFDYSVLHRPILFFAYDLDNYRDNLRGFYLDYESDVPGPVLETEDELWSAISTLEETSEQLSRQSAEFARRFAPHDDGRAAERVVDAVFGPEIR